MSPEKSPGNKGRIKKVGEATILTLPNYQSDIASAVNKLRKAGHKQIVKYAL